MRKIRVGMRFYECGKDRRSFKIVSVSHKTGYALTDRGTKIRLSRLVVSKHYKECDY